MSEKGQNPATEIEPVQLNPIQIQGGSAFADVTGPLGEQKTRAQREAEMLAQIASLLARKE